MKKVILSVLLGIIAFASGIVGTFMLVPSLAPERSQYALALADSLIQADSLAHTATYTPNRLQLLKQLLDGNQKPPPSAEEQLLAILGLTPDSLKSIIQRAQEVELLRDSLSYLKQELERATRHQQEILQEIETLKQKWSLAESELKRAAELSKVLPKLDDKQLAAVVRDLDPRIFQRIYLKATNRNRMRLLKALPPDKATEFVENLVALGELLSQSTPSQKTSRQ